MKRDEHDRITFDGNQLDEIVARGGLLHIEALDAHNFMIAWYDHDGERIHLRGSNLVLEDHDHGEGGIPETWGPKLTYCGHKWEAPGTDHTCTRKSGHDGRHTCDCGSYRRGQR